MDLAKRIEKDTCNVTFSGSFTFNEHMEFRSILSCFAESEVKEVVLHMAKVDFIDSAALGMLLLALDEAEKHQKRLTLRGANGQVKKMFNMARFDTMFTLD